MPLALSLAFALTFQLPARTPYLHSPAVEATAKIVPDGVSVLPNGRFVRPVGRSIPVAQNPHGLEVSPDGNTAFVAAENSGQFVDGWNSGSPTVRKISFPDGKSHENAGGSAFSPDGKLLYWAGGNGGNLYVVDVATQQVTNQVTLNVSVAGKSYEDSVILDVKLSPDGKTLYCADVANFRVVSVDVASQKVVGSVGVGRYPYALAVKGNRVYVANIGMFSYSDIDKPKGTDYDARGLTRPAFGFPSKEARDGAEFEGRRVAGLGDPNVPESFSVWGIDASDPSKMSILTKVKTGLLVDQPAERGKTVGGSAPNFLAIQGDTIFVSDGNNDLVEQISITQGKVLKRTEIVPSPLVSKLRGVGPSGLAVSPDGSRVFVAESGINAIGVIDTQSGRVLGHIPTAWYPYRISMTPDGKKLAVICFKSFGNGPRGVADVPKSPFLGMRGTFTELDVPSSSELKNMTGDVLAFNGIVDRTEDLAKMASPVIPTAPGQLSKEIQYVVFITKENHTYDAVFDHVPGANDDANLLRWGYHQDISAKGQPSLKNVAVMTNHNALARQFVVSDNFYMEPEASGVGHRWLVGVQPNNFCQMTYTLGWEFKAKTTAPGRRASFGSNGSIAPEDYPEAGSMWEHLARQGVPFRNYGEGFEFAGVNEDENERKTGAREVVNIPMPKVLFDNTCFDFPIFNMNIPDQYRAYWFEKDFTNKFLGEKKQPLGFINIAICNDHGTGPNPEKGYPYVASWMADNDLALGRIVDFLSHTPYWKHMAIFVTQDDSGGENDHVDAQRSVLLLISPWAKRRYVSHRHTTITSMHRTLYEIFGLPPLNMFDALANDFSDCFTTTPDFTPYSAVAVDPRIFDPEKAKDPKDPDYLGARKLPTIQRDDEEEEKKVREG